MAKNVKEHSDGAFELKEGTLYIALKRLEVNGYIRSYWDDGESKGGRRKYYAITENGQSFYQTKIDEWAFMKKMMDDFISAKKSWRGK
ncbi:PadR family transcriptional regulator [Vallitalea okinawensis]|uniref:PadR family transcriptional regulator n=1 Tax=Vallitalea okinawensis TaxID=2078660 RepID=UPI001FA88BD7